MKDYIDIPKIRETDVIVNKTLTLPANISTFHEGDIVSITELLNGITGSVKYNPDIDKLECYANHHVLDKSDLCKGFYKFVSKLNVEPFKRYSNYEFFGTWMLPCGDNYDLQYCHNWYLFSIYDYTTESWLPQSFVKGFATKYQLNYTYELYFGPFLGWDHVYGFTKMPHYGKYQYGIVIKNQTGLEGHRLHHVLKYVNKKLCLSVKNDDVTKEFAEKYVRKLVTVELVDKSLSKLKALGEIPSDVTLADMNIVAQKVTESVYSYCKSTDINFEKNTGQFGKQLVSHVAMPLVRTLLFFS